MKKITTAVFLLCSIAFAKAQNGLENIIVETYYISDANDTMANMDGGDLPIGSVTYRIYADMLPGYKFQAAYGVNTPGAAHECRIETTTLFFNNLDRGATSPTFTKTNAARNTVMLDSWLTVGAACNGNFGVLKTSDDGAATVVNNYTPQVLQDSNPGAGIPLTQQDGFLLGSPEPVTTVGISTEILVFDDLSIGNLFTTDNGSWASLNGSTGPDSATNQVLIAQITTDGVLCFQLNIQIGTPNGGVENYVAMNPMGTEILLPSLNYCSNTVGINDHVENSSLFMVYPNPVSDLLKIKVIPSRQHEPQTLTIADITGQVIWTKELESSSEKYLETVNMSSFVRGIYIATLQSGDALYTKKLVRN